MALALKEAQTANELAGSLYPFLPARRIPMPIAISPFQALPPALGLGHHWSGGSKGPAIARLLVGTLERARSKFLR
jgi:hypothetical protein